MGAAWFCMGNVPRSEVVPYQADRIREFESKLVDYQKPVPPPIQIAVHQKEDLAVVEEEDEEDEDDKEGEENFIRRFFSKKLLNDLRRELLKRTSSKLEQSRPAHQLAVVLVRDEDEGEEKEEEMVCAPEKTKRTSWVELKDGAGEAYFYDLVTREIAWEKPAEL
ncbi:hypothetical protein BASA82_000628 [Batrachochytrium salamandrivorans]|nr:hypothetical protein BASA81_004181 [Batrachochytrium salamandrivorans]KAH9262309.1 hypothetical protein BASA82_000628 [Batrachochytrium salamandrivorans]